MTASDPAPERTMDLGRSDAPPGRAGRGSQWTRLYRGGRPEADADGPAQACRVLEGDADLMAWTALASPDRAQLDELAEALDLPDLAREDAVVAHQRPKVEVHGDVLLLVLRPARYDEAREEVEVGEVHVFVRDRVVATVHHPGPEGAVDLDRIRERVERQEGLLEHGPLAVLHAVLDGVVDGYAPVVSALQADIDEVESQVFGGDPGASRRTYRLARQVIMLQRAVDPLDGVLRALMAPLEGAGAPGRPLRAQVADAELLYSFLRDVADHATTVREHVDGFRQLLQNIMAVNSALIDQAQNEAMKKVSSWGGILVVPTLIASVYGMNMDPRPGFEWLFSWPAALALMVLSSLALYTVFRRRGWL